MACTKKRTQKKKAFKSTMARAGRQMKSKNYKTRAKGIKTWSGK